MDEKRKSDKASLIALGIDTTFDLISSILDAVSDSSSDVLEAICDILKLFTD